MSSLKPCAFCESNDLESEKDSGLGWYVCCKKCGAKGPVSDIDASEAWNDRPLAGGYVDAKILVQIGRSAFGGPCPPGWFDAARQLETLIRENISKG